MELWAILTLILLLYISLVIVRKGQWWKNKYHYPPGPTSLPFIGNLLQIHLNDIVNSLMKLHKKHGSLYTIHLGPQRYVVLCGYETMKKALIENADAFSGRGPYPLFYNFTKGNGITFSNGEKWKQLRRFAVSALVQLGMGKRSVEERIQEEVNFLMAFFRETKGTPFDPEFCMSRSLSNIISSIVFGNRFDYEDEDFELVVGCVQNSFQIMSSTWGMLYHIYSDILDYLPGPHVKIFQNLRRMESFILRRAKKNEETLDPNCPRDYIDMFLIKMEQEKNNPCTFFNWDSLVMSTLILFFAAIESCSATLRFGFIHLLKNPEIQEKAQEEIDRVIGCNTSPTFEHKARMPYMQALIHEIQRYCDVIPLSITHLLTQDTDFEGYKFQKGTVFIPLMTSVHFDPTQFNNPEKFDPANFLDENGSFQMKDAFMPFSAGKRFCLGAGLASMELFIYFTTILQKFKLKPTSSPEEVNACPKGIFLSNVPCPFKFSLIPR